MALLTADDVHWKQFHYTKFREGYDQEEVDEFLDEVVETIAALQEEKETLIQQLDKARQAAAEGQPLPAADESETVAQLRDELESANAQVAQLQQDVQSARHEAALASKQQAPVEDGAAAEQIANLQAALAQSQAEANQARQEASAAQSELQRVQEEQAKQAEAAQDEPQDATSMLSLAQRVHDEYVKNGQEEGDRIIADSRAKGDQIVREANDERQRVLDNLSSDRGRLEAEIDDLKSFRADYRTRLAEHLSGLLEQVKAEDAN